MYILLVGSVIVCFFLYFLHYFLLYSTYFQVNPISAVNTYTIENYPPQPAVVYLFVKFIYLPFMLNIKPNFIKGAGSAKMLHSFAAFEVLMERTFFVFSAFLFLFMESQ